MLPLYRDDMARNVRLLRCSPAEVFAVLSDGWLYPGWVVGASRMRDVAESWPEAGSRLHHSFGTWPLLIDDTTRVEVWDPPRRMVLLARGWPMGEARVSIEVKPRGTGCAVRIDEHPVAGPGSAVSALIDPLLRWRNKETLHRLALLAEGGARRPVAEAAPDSPAVADPNAPLDSAASGAPDTTEPEAPREAADVDTAP